VTKLRITEAFAKYGATLRNPRWAYSAIAADGSPVLSCWQRYLTSQPDGALCYEVNDFSHWSANPYGKSLLRGHLKQAFEDKLPVRMVLVTTTPPKAVVAGVDASKVPKTFQVREDLVGRVIEFTSERFVIDFREAQA
jgi:hypothetical protein